MTPAGSKVSKSVTQQTVSGMGWMMMGKIFVSVFRIVFVSVLAHLLVPKDFGVFQTATILTSFAEIVTQIGIGPALVQIKELKEGHVSVAFIFSMLIGVVLTGVVYAVAPWWASLMNSPEQIEVLHVMAWIFPISSLSAASFNLLHREMSFKKVSIVEIVSFFFGYGLFAVTVAVFGTGDYWALVYGTLAQSSITALMLFILQPHRINFSFNKSHFRDLIEFGGGLTISRLFNWAAKKGDYVVIGKFLGENALGLYGRAYNLMSSSVSLFGTALDKVVFSSMSRRQDDFEVLKKAYLRGLSAIAVVILPVSFCSALLSEEIVGALLGPKFSQAVVPLRILSLVMSFRVSYKMSGALARATGKVYRNAFRQAIYAVLVVVLVFVGQLFYGLNGASLGVAISLIIHFVLMTHMAKGILNNVSWGEIMKTQLNPLALACFVCGGAYLINQLIGVLFSNPFVNLAGFAVWFPIAYLLSWFFSKKVFYGDSGQWLVNTIVEFAPRKKQVRKFLRLTNEKNS